MIAGRCGAAALGSKRVAVVAAGRAAKVAVKKRNVW